MAPALLDPYATHGVFIAITRTEVPVARNKYPEEAVEKILDVAERLFVERGYEHTTMICRAIRYIEKGKPWRR